MSATATMNDASLADFDDDFSVKKDALADVPDGEHEFEIKSMEIKKGPMVKFNLELLTEGPCAGGEFEKLFFLTKKNKDTGLVEKNEKAKCELADALTKLGFDVENWTPENGRPTSKELPKVCAVVPGMKVVMKKKQGDKKNDGTYWQNLNFVRRGANDGKPATIDAKYLEEANEDPLG